MDLRSGIGINVCYFEAKARFSANSTMSRCYTILLIAHRLKCCWIRSGVDRLRKMKKDRSMLLLLLLGATTMQSPTIHPMRKNSFLVAFIKCHFPAPLNNFDVLGA